MSSCSDHETLLDLVIRGRWSTLASRAETNPGELAAVGADDGMTVFHWVCVNDAPVRTLRALLRQDELQESLGYERAVLIKDLCGVTPLMSACVHASSKEHVQCLVESAPEAISMADNDGWTAMHYLCHNARHKYSFACSVLPLLLSRSAEENDELAFRVENTGNHTPLSLACDAFGVCEDSLQERRRGISKTECDPVYCLQYALRFLDLLLPAERKDWPLMSKVLSFTQVPLVLIDMAILITSGDALLEVNDDLDTPLHVAVSKPWQTGLANRVVSACPLAASLRNRDGLLPLQVGIMMANENWSEDLGALVDANPAALQVIGLDDSIYPYLLARIKRHETMFEILKSRPTLVHRRI